MKSSAPPESGAPQGCLGPAAARNVPGVGGERGHWMRIEIVAATRNWEGAMAGGV